MFNFSEDICKTLFHDLFMPVVFVSCVSFGYRKISWQSLGMHLDTYQNNKSLKACLLSLSFFLDDMA